MAEISIAGAFTTEVHDYLTGLQEESMAAAEKAARYLYEQAIQRAKDNPEWAQFADHIEVWAEDGYLVIGIRDEAMVSQAFQLEYGDEHRPPNSLFRALRQDTRGAGDVMTEHMQSVYGHGKIV